MRMRDWSEKRDTPLKFIEQNILLDKGKMAHDVTVALAKKEYESFRVKQDGRFASDFDREMKKLLAQKKKKSKVRRRGMREEYEFQMEIAGPAAMFAGVIFSGKEEY